MDEASGSGSGPSGSRYDLAPLNIMEYTFSEKMLFVDTVQIAKLTKVFPRIKRRDIRPYVLLSLKEMMGETPNVSGVADIEQYVAIRTLVQTIYKEAEMRQTYKASRTEVTEYLLSLGIAPDCCQELIATLYGAETFQRVPSSVRLHPTILHSRWLIDLCQCRQFINDWGDREAYRKMTALRRSMNVIILIHLTNGKQKAIGVKWEELGKFRLQIAEALRSAQEVDRRLRKREEVNLDNLRSIKAEGRF